MPLDASLASTCAVQRAVQRLGMAGVEAVALHVFDSEHTPPFMDHASRAFEVWKAEFLALYCPEFTARLLTRHGDAPTAIVQTAVQEGADMIVLSWGQSLDPKRGRVVREVLLRAPVPVVLLPMERGVSREVLEPSG